MRLGEFLAGPLTYLYPAPGGTLMSGGDHSADQADAYMAAIAALIKQREMSRAEAIDVLYMKMEQVKNQEHFGTKADLLIIGRLGEWIRDLAN